MDDTNIPQMEQLLLNLPRIRNSCHKKAEELKDFSEKLPDICTARQTRLSAAFPTTGATARTKEPFPYQQTLDSLGIQNKILTKLLPALEETFETYCQEAVQPIYH